MRTIIKLTESDLHKIIENVVREAINDEVNTEYQDKIRRRNDNYLSDIRHVDTPYERAHGYGCEPGVEDYLESESPFHYDGWFDDKVSSLRRQRHNRTQNHRGPDDFTESIIRESVKSVLREWQFDDDLDYERIYDNACDFLSRNHGLTTYGWREIAEGMGFILNSIGPNDMETLKDAIEDAMYEIDVPSNEKADIDFEYDMRK